MNMQPTDRQRLFDRISQGAMGAGTAVAALIFFAAVALYRPAPQPLPDFSRLDNATERKTAFFEFLAPIVADQNARVRAQRERLLEVAPRVSDGQRLGWSDRRWIRDLAAEYELDWPGESRQQTLELLIRRVDVVPVPLALVQAATESGWGRSRFAREGNNLFGQWCYTPGCGIVPGQRAETASHEVAAFESVSESVRRYINNLNTHRSYLPLRIIREALREQGERPRALRLADGLIRYSERREAYVEEIKQVIRANRPLIDRVLTGETDASVADDSSDET